MPNLILERWRDVLSARSGPAIYSPSGGIFRTWADIEAEARDFEGRLSGSSGGVALQTGNHPAFPALLLACLRTGRPASLFDAGLFDEARPQIEEQLGVTLRVVARNGKLCFENGAGHVELASRLLGQKGNRGGRPTFAPSGTGDVVCLYKLTSGTTSLPQPIGFTAEQLVADCDQVCVTMGIHANDLNYGIIALTHSYGFSNLATPLLCRGVRLVVATDPLPRAIECGLKSTGATVLPAVPVMFRALLSAGSLPASLRLCISAGSPLDPALAVEFREKFGRKIHAFYGASECGGICYDATEDILNLPGFVGKPLHGVDIGIPENTDGAKIFICSQAIGVGVADADGGFQPTDLLVHGPEGFRIVGRESDLINVAGRKVNPMEIEQVLAQFPGVDEAVVCGVDDPARGQEICALVVSKTTLDIPLLRRHCAAALASWKVPRRFVLATGSPRNARGKISRPEIARKFFPPGESA